MVDYFKINPVSSEFENKRKALEVLRLQIIIPGLLFNIYKI